MKKTLMAIINFIKRIKFEITFKLPFIDVSIVLSKSQAPQGAFSLSSTCVSE